MQSSSLPRGTPVCVSLPEAGQRLLLAAQVLLQLAAALVQAGLCQC